MNIFSFHIFLRDLNIFVKMTNNFFQKLTNSKGKYSLA